MYTMTIRGPDGSEVEYPLADDQGLIVGRDDTCDVVLPSKRVSRRHARFFTTGSTLQLEDLGSQNGIFVGGARITGTVEIRPGPPIEIGEFKVRFTKVDPRAVAAAGEEEELLLLEGRLKGLGAHVGKELPLPPERGIVGREKTADLPVVDDSVSRRHAEIRLEAGMVHIVTDLGSSNGTFVNGSRLKPNLPQRLKHNDKLRFGETHWQYLAGAGQRGAGGGGPSDKHKKLIVAAAAIVALVGVAIALSRPPPQTGEVVEEISPEDLAAEAIGRGQQALESDKFEEAKQAFQAALEADPVNTDARLLLRRTEGEIETERVVREAAQKSEVGRNEEALKLYFQLTPDSRFFARARLKVQEIAAAQMRRDIVECREAGRRGNTRLALTVCARYLDYKCHSDVDKVALAALRAAEKRNGSKEPWSCPARLAAWFSAGTTAVVDTDKAIAARYSDREIREAVGAYASGELETAQKILARAKTGSSAKIAEELAEHVALVAGLYKEGQTAFLKGNLRDAERAFRSAIESDGRVMPTKVPSYHGREMRNMLARALYDAGRGAWEKSNYTEAFDVWSRGVEFQPNDAQLFDGLAKLERAAESLLSSAPNCDDLNKVIHITRAEPPSAAHQKAADLLAEQCE